MKEWQFDTLQSKFGALSEPPRRMHAALSRSIHTATLWVGVPWALRGSVLHLPVPGGLSLSGLGEINPNAARCAWPRTTRYVVRLDTGTEVSLKPSSLIAIDNPDDAPSGAGGFPGRRAEAEFGPLVWCYVM